MSETKTSAMAVVGTLEKGVPPDHSKIAAMIKADHAQVCKAMKLSLTFAKKAGGNLVQIQNDMNHKTFVSWCQTECGISESTALNYIRVHKNWVEVENEENYTAALKALRKTRKDKVAKVEAPLDAWETKLADAMTRFSVKATLANMTLLLAFYGVKKE